MRHDILKETLLLVIVFIVSQGQIQGQSEKNIKSELDGNWSSLPSYPLVNRNQRYSSYLNDYFEIQIKYPNIQLYDLAKDSAIQYGSIKSINNDTIVISTIDPENVELKYFYLKKNKSLFLSDDNSNVILDTLFLIENLEVPLNNNILSILNNEDQRLSWLRFHNYLIQKKLIDLKTIDNETKNWKKKSDK